MSTVQPPSYSFKKIKEHNGVSTYYTKPSSIHEYDTAEQVLEEYNKILDHLGNNKWAWIIDGDGFEIKYALEMKSGMGFAKLLSGKHGENLQTITIVNPTLCIKMLVKAITPFLSSIIQKKVKMLTDRYYSLLEFL